MGRRVVPKEPLYVDKRGKLAKTGLGSNPRGTVSVMDELSAEQFISDYVEHHGDEKIDGVTFREWLLERGVI